MERFRFLLRLHTLTGSSCCSSPWFGLFRSVSVVLGWSVVFMMLLSRPVYSDQVTPSGEVKTFLNVRSSPSNTGTIIGKLAPGEKADLVRSIEAWHQIRLAGGTTGYVSRSWTVPVVVPAEQPLPEKTPPLDQQPTPQETAGGTPDSLYLTRIQLLADSIGLLDHDIDSLTRYIGGLQTGIENRSPSSRNSLLLIIAIAVALCATAVNFIPRKKKPPVETPVLDKPNEAPAPNRTSRKSYFVVTSPCISSGRGTFCNLHINFINAGDHPATSFEASVYFIDLHVREAEIYREFRFNTVNPIGSQADITFTEEDIDFTEECSPKFVCVATEYVDHELKRRCKQDFTFRWDGVHDGVPAEECKHVEQEKSELVWIRIRELRWQRGSRLRNWK